MDVTRSFRDHGRNALRELAASPLLPDRCRAPLLRRSGVHVGRRALIRAGLRVVRPGTVVIEDGVFINDNCYIAASADVVIEQGASLADHVRIITATHEIGDRSNRAGRDDARPVRIGAGTWVGSGVVVLPGVTVGAGCVVAAGAMVLRDCDPDGLYAGVPATLRRSLG